MRQILESSRKHRAWLTVSAALFACLALRGQGAAQQTVTWNHKECPATAAPTSAECNPVRQITVADGEIMKVVIENTCPELFDYTVVRIPRSSGGTPQSAQEDECTETKGDLQIRHDDQYGGYVIHINRTSGSPNVGSARLTISVRTAEWDVSFSGGFNGTGLVNRTYSLRDTASASTGSAQTTTETKYRIVEDDDNDDVGRSVASFVHLQHTAHPLLGLTFGVGIDADRSSEYYFGPSIHLGNGGSINFGGVIGSVRSLPSGRRIGDLVTDANLLSNLRERTVLRGFLGVSFRFLNGSAKESLAKPFLGRTPTESAAAGVDDSAGAGRNAAPDKSGGGEQGTAAELALTGNPVTVNAGASGTLTVKVADKNGKGLAGYVVTIENAADLAGMLKMTTQPEDALTPDTGEVRLNITALAGATGSHTLKLQARRNAGGTSSVSQDATVVIQP